MEERDRKEAERLGNRSHTHEYYIIQCQRFREGGKMDCNKENGQERTNRYDLYRRDKDGEH